MAAGAGSGLAAKRPVTAATVTLTKKARSNHCPSRTAPARVRGRGNKSVETGGIEVMVLASRKQDSVHWAKPAQWLENVEL
jgi:hypothetical protein